MFSEKKNSSTYIEVGIAYTEHEAKFNMDDWALASGMIEETTKKQMEDYVKDDTIEVTFWYSGREELLARIETGYWSCYVSSEASRIGLELGFWWKALISHYLFMALCFGTEIADGRSSLPDQN
jgi:hypothetical protein